MYKQEEIKPYDAKTDKGEQVEQMFDHIAPTYDRLNRRLSWRIDTLWRKKVIRQLQVTQPKMILDVATGTGDIAIQCAKALPDAQIIGIDLSDQMLQIAEQKTAAKGLSDRIRYQKDDCMNLSFADETFDAVTAAFGIRNFEDLDGGLKEMCRVLKKGGVLSIAELTEPVSFPMKQLFHCYSHTILPFYGKLISRDNIAYSYLTATIEAFPQGERMVEILKDAGFAQTSFKRLTCGICTIYYGVK